MLTIETKYYLRTIFNKIFKSVKPKELIPSQLTVLNNKLIVHGQQYHLNKNCYVVGFGKAVYGMGYEVHSLLKDHVRKAIFSVPEGSLNPEDNFHLNNSHIKVYEGAKNNIPDRNSYRATRRILDLVDGLRQTDLLVVLISGGGSALLVSPVEGVTLEEKVEATKSLARSGFDISHLNSVRKKLSEVKGGRLAARAHPATIVSLILSDVVGDPLEVIASGPTVPDSSSLPAIDDCSLPDSVLDALRQPRIRVYPKIFENSHVFIIGNNTRALMAGKSFVEEDGRTCCVLTSQIQGLVDRVAIDLAHFVINSCYLLLGKLAQDEYKAAVSNHTKNLHVSEESLNECLSILSDTRDEVFLFLGGETTVHVRGEGLGGRNMELALRFTHEFSRLSKESEDLKDFEVGLLCGGTDGIDGPTDAAGAISYPEQAELASQQGLDIQEYLANNDSYHFFKTFDAGQDLIVTGHTGTNVMDVIIVYLKKR